MERRGIIISLIGFGSLAAGWVYGIFVAGVHRRGYDIVARWEIPGGEGWIIAVDSKPTPQQLRSLGDELKEELRRLDDAVVMVFDDRDAARLVRRGFRMVGEEQFQAALLHQRAMYLKSSDRGEHRLTLYERYPTPHEVIRYGSAHLQERNG